MAEIIASIRALRIGNGKDDWIPAWFVVPAVPGYRTESPSIVASYAWHETNASQALSESSAATESR
jgi:hypothetical protein